jgi:hypothetical protein
MNRTRKLYERLEQSEKRYAALLRAECTAVLDGCLGNYLGRKLRADWDSVIGGRSPDVRANDLDDLETEIQRLRRKLGEPIPGVVVGITDTLIARIKDAGEWSPGCNKSWLRNAIVQLASSVPAVQ